MATVEPLAIWDVRPWGCPMVKVADIDGDGLEELLVTDRETVWVFGRP